MVFEEIIINKYLILRKFSKNLEYHQLQWHVDLEDRLVYSLLPTNWYIQLDNQLPQLITSQPIEIQSNVWHRLIKPSQTNITDLFVYIQFI